MVLAVIPVINLSDHRFDSAQKMELGQEMKLNVFVSCNLQVLRAIFNCYFSVKTCPSLTIALFGMAVCRNADLNMIIDYSPRNGSFIENYNPEVHKTTENFSIDTECEFSCAYGFSLVGSAKRHCLPVAKWDGLQASCKRK